MNILYSTKIYSLERKGFVWIIFLFLFLISCSDTKFEVDKEYEQYLIANLDKADKESRVSFLRSEYSTCTRSMVAFEDIKTKLIGLLGEFKDLKRNKEALGIDSSPIDEQIKAAEERIVMCNATWKVEKRKFNTIIKVAKMYGISTLSF